MKIEKISDTQIKFILTHADLVERNIRLSELTHGSDKTQRLFQDMMRQALAEFDFESENAPLMVEAMPMDENSVMIVVTKITDASAIEQRLNLMPLAKSRFKRKELIEPTEDTSGEDSISIFSFDALDTLTDAAAQLSGHFTGISQAYKLNGRYFLLLQNETEDDRITADLEAILHEFGQKHVSNILSRQYLAERAEVLIADSAIEKLAAYLA